VALHVTAVSEEPVTLAENCCDAPSTRGADFGLMATLTEEGGGFCEGGPPALLVEPPHPERSKSKKSRGTYPMTRRERMLAAVFGSRTEAVDKTKSRRGMVWTPQNRLTVGGAAQNCTDGQIWRRHGRWPAARAGPVFRHQEERHSDKCPLSGPEGGLWPFLHIREAMPFALSLAPQTRSLLDRRPEKCGPSFDPDSSIFSSHKSI
jgi:hypothetical protein